MKTVYFFKLCFINYHNTDVNFKQVPAIHFLLDFKTGLVGEDLSSLRRFLYAMLNLTFLYAARARNSIMYSFQMIVIVFHKPNNINHTQRE